MDSSQSFSSDYTQSRDRFREAAIAAGAKLDQLQLDVQGPNSDNLTVDIAWLGAETPRRVVLHTSGVHGVEGFVGSAIQLDLLTHPPHLREDAVVFVHGINPYGMAWLRRFNENNVDLNRNFLGPDEEYEGAAEGYRRLSGFLNPKTPPRTFDPFLPAALWNVLRHGFRPLKQAVAQGQYEYPQGVFFGGKQLEQSPRLLMDWLKQRLGKAEKAVVIDVHTGLGKYGRDALLVSYEPGNEEFVQLRRLLGEQLASLSPDSVAYRIRGGFLDALERDILGPDWTCICQEFGTFGPLRVLKALREENRWHHYGQPEQTDHPAKCKLLEAFCPEDREWRRAILKRGRELFETVAGGLLDFPLASQPQ